MSQTKKVRKTSAISFNELAPTSEEKRALQTIIEAQHWNRRKLKDDFAATYGRPIEEVEEYVRSRARRWDKEGATIDELVAEVPAPKKTIVQKDKSSRAETKQFASEQTLSPLAGTELRLTFKKLRIEGNALIIEF